VQKIIELAQQLTVRQEDETESVAKSLGLEARPNLERPVLSETSATDMPRLHLINPRPGLSRRVVMVIYTDALRPDFGKSQIAPTDRNLLGLSEPPRRYYWRGITYDRYGGHGWSTERTVTLKYEAGEPVISEDMPFHRVIQQEVQVVGDPSTSSGHRLDEMLYVAGTLVTADQDFSVARRSPEDIFGASIKANTYRVESLVPVVSEEQLRSAGSDYPEWVRGRYLTLPDRVPDRILALARDLTATEPTSYDRALAIESYLRTFPYTLDVPSPPLNRDIADYFLFDLQRGHCEYYATAMAVLARAAGLPARLVVGYANGTYDANNDRYIVTEADAHTWVEIYFPKYGWVEFEPTGKRPPIERLAESPVEWPELEGSPEPAGLLELVSVVRSRVVQFWWLGVLGGLALASLVSVIRSVVDGWRLHFLTPVATATILYRRLQRHGRRLAITMQEGDTPYEFATSFAEHFADLARGKYWWDTILAPAVQEAQLLVSLYVQASYTPCSPNTDDQREGIQTWRRLHRRLWVAWVLHGLGQNKVKRGGKT
jgi:transglutaminase-like putative cysteine protease